jgi:hypothetical protein
MLQAMSAPAHSERHPHLKIHEQRLMKNTQSTANEMAKGDHLVSMASTRGDQAVSQPLNHVFHQAQAAVSVQRQDRFGMKLDRFHRKFAMADAHDDAVLALSGDFEARREFFGDRV